jgi:hypothetical protein
MFLRIDNKPATTWEVRDFGQGMRAFGWLFVHGDPADNNPRNSTLPVVLNPCLKQLDISRNAVWRAFNGGETLELNHQDSLTLQQLEQHGNRGFLSDPHCKTIKVKLGLRFGIRVYITVESTVESETPLTINAVIARTLPVCPINKHVHEQVLVWTLINEQTDDLKTLKCSKQTR